ncbi:MAG TPA: hypothetical protein VEO20_03815 [Thermoplasmata archaeon]|nr:hypothetical protein [Thermoplasmata archaeon]
MPGKPNIATGAVPKDRRGSGPETPVVRGNPSGEKPETTAIVLRVAADRAAHFEAIFGEAEIPIWEDFANRGRFLEARLVRANGGSEQRTGIQDYVLFVVAADHEAHEEHDRDPRFRAFLEKAERLQPEPPLVWYGDTIVERRS